MKWLRAKLIDIIIKDFRLVREEDLFRLHEGRYFIGNRALTSEEVERLAYDAERLSNSMIWLILTTQLEHEAIKKGMREATSIDHILAGKSMMYTVDVLRSLVDKIRRL